MSRVICTIQGNLIIGEVLAVATNTLQSTTDAGPTTTNAITISDSTNAENRATGALKISGGVGVGGDAWATNVNAVSYLSVGKETPNGASNVFEVVGDSNVGTSVYVEHRHGSPGDQRGEREPHVYPGAGRQHR